jgi:hypothetical protein
MNAPGEILLSSVDRMKAAHYAVCTGCSTCQPSNFPKAAPSKLVLTEAAADAPRGGKRTPAPMVDVDKAVEAGAWLEAYTGTWSFMQTLQSELRAGKLRFTPRVIEVILNAKAREAAWAEQRAPLAEAIKSAVAVSEASEGWYEIDGAVVKVQKAIHGSGKLYAKRLNVEVGAASWEYVPGLVRQCNDSNRLSAERAMEMGQLYGVCVVCGAVLTDEQSIARGIGPICFGKLG